jgi:hypothetical protein
VFVQLPPGVEPRSARVELTTHAIAVHVGDERVLAGPLFAPVKAEESVWLVSESLALAASEPCTQADARAAHRPGTADGVLEIQLLKRNRRGQYSNGCTNADTFWFSLLADRSGRERLALQRPPDAYYNSDWERIGCADANKLRGRRGSRATAPAAIRAA